MLSLSSCCCCWVRWAASACGQRVSGLIVRAKGGSYSLAEARAQWLVPLSSLTFLCCKGQNISCLWGDVLHSAIMISSTPSPSGMQSVRPSPCNFLSSYLCMFRADYWHSRWSVFQIRMLICVVSDAVWSCRKGYIRLYNHGIIIHKLQNNYWASTASIKDIMI